MFHKMTPEQWNEVIDTNLTGLFNMTHPVWTGMRDRKFGRVINISSINGQKGQAGQANYSASKAGDIGFTKALAQEGARAGITVNAICPGYIATEMVHGHRRGGAERRASCRRSRSAGSASRKRSRAASCSSPPTMPASSPARRSRPMAASSSRNRAGRLAPPAIPCPPSLKAAADFQSPVNCTPRPIVAAFRRHEQEPACTDSSSSHLAPSS